MPNPKPIATPFAETGTRNDIPESGASEPQFATMQAGFPSATQTPISEGGIPPERADFNGAFHLTTSHLSFLNKGNWYGFDAAFAGQIGGYDKNAILMLENGELVQNTQPNNTNNPNVNMSGWIKLNSTAKDVVTTVESTSDLSSLDAWEGRLIEVKSRLKPTNLALSRPYKGGGLFIYISASTAADDGGYVFGKWIRVIQDPFVTAEQFGARPYEDSIDDYQAIQAALNTNREVRLETGRYVISKPLIVQSQQTLIGEGLGKTIITKTGTAFSEVDTTGFSGAMATVNYNNKDAVVIVLPQPANYAKYVRIENLALNNGTSTSNGKGYCLFAPYVSESKFSQILLNYGLTPHYSINCWMCEWDFVHVFSSGTGFIFGGKEGDTGRGGTSNNLSNCWVVGTKAEYPYQFYGNMYSTMSDCGADGNGTSETYVEGIVYAVRSTITINSLGAEGNYAKRIINNVASRLTVNTLQVLNFHNTSGNSTALFAVLGTTARTIVSNGSLEFTNFANPTTLNSPKFGSATDGSLLYFEYLYVDQNMTGINNGTPFEITKDTTSSVEFKTQSATLADYGTQSTALSTNNNVTSNQNYIVRSLQSSDKILTTATALYADVGFLNDAACRYNTAKFKLGNSSIFRDSFGRPRFKLNGNPAEQYDGIPMDGLEVSATPPAWVARAGHMYFNSTDNTIRVFTSGGWMKVALTAV